MRVRFSIRGIMAGVLLVALGTAALRFATELTAGITLSSTLLLLGVAALGGLYGRGSTRASCGGFAAFGFAYLALAMGPWAADHIGPHLASTHLLRYAGPRIDSTQQPATQVLGLSTNPPVGSAVPILNKTSYVGRLFRTSPPQAMTSYALTIVSAPTASEDFMRAGHSLFALLAGALGGVVARAFQGGRRRRQDVVPADRPTQTTGTLDATP